MTETRFTFQIKYPRNGSHARFPIATGRGYVTVVTKQGDPPAREIAARHLGTVGGGPLYDFAFEYPEPFLEFTEGFYPAGELARWDADSPVVHVGDEQHSNWLRALWARQAVQLFAELHYRLADDQNLDDPDSRQMVVSDLLGNMIHWLGYDGFQDALALGLGRYEEERDIAICDDQEARAARIEHGEANG